MNNYNSLNYRTVSIFSILSAFLVGNTQTKSSNKQKSWLVSLMIMITLLFSVSIQSQTAANYSFKTDPLPFLTDFSAFFK